MICPFCSVGVIGNHHGGATSWCQSCGRTIDQEDLPSNMTIDLIKTPPTSTQLKTTCPKCSSTRLTIDNSHIPETYIYCEDCGNTMLAVKRSVKERVCTSKENSPPVALKYDKGLDKLPWDLLPFKATEGMLRVLSYGQRKYSVCAQCKKSIYPNPRLDGDPPRHDCPHCGGDIIEGSHNWRKGFKWTRLIAAAFRHIVEIAKGNDIDDGPDGSGLLHVDHLLCCAAFLSEHMQDKLGEDDRYKNEKEL